MNAPIKTDEGITIRSLAREELNANEGDVRKAIDALTARLAADKRLMREVVADAVVIASETLVQHKMRDDRAAVVLSATRAKNGVIALANGLRSAILDFPLAGGIKLREASPDQVMQQVERYDSIGRDVMHKARWLQLIAQGVPRNKKIGEVITDERAQQLWDEASK